METASPNDGGIGQFTHANLFSTFLTLFFSILTQPFGSLLMGFPLDPPLSRFQRIALQPVWLWRLNPLAAATEGWLILLLLVEHAVRSWTSSPPAPLRTRLRDLLKELQILATALLMVRAHQSDKVKIAILQDLKSFPGVIYLFGCDQEGGNLFPRGGKTSFYEDENVPPHNANLHTTSPSGNQDLDALLQALSGTSPGHHRWADAVSVLCIVTTTVKLSFIMVPWQLRTILLFMVLGWFAVWLLLLLEHSQDLATTDKALVARKVLMLAPSFPWLREKTKPSRGRERDPLTKWRDVLLKSFATAILAYICYAIIFTFPFSFEKDKHGLEFTPIGILVFWWRFGIFTLTYMSILHPAMPFLMISPKTWHMFDRLGERPKYMLWAGWVVTVGALGFQYPDVCKAVLMALMFLLMVGIEVWYFVDLHREGNGFGFFRWLNPAVVGLGIPAVFQLYSPDKSFKPGWLDWLG